MYSCFLHTHLQRLIVTTHNTLQHYCVRGGVIVSVLVSGSTGLGSSPGQEHIVVYLGTQFTDV